MITRMTPADELPQFLNVAEAAAWLGVGRSFLYDHLRQEELPCVQLGRLVRIPREALIAFAQRPYKPTKKSAERHS